MKLNLTKDKYFTLHYKLLGGRGRNRKPSNSPCAVLCVPCQLWFPGLMESLSEQAAKCSRTSCRAILSPLDFHTPTQQQDAQNWLLTRHSMAVKVIPYGLLELMIRRPFLEPLIEKMSQVLVQLSSCRKYMKETQYINNRASWKLSSLRAMRGKATWSHSISHS